MKKNMIHNRKGISLLEVLMVIGLMTALATGAAQLFDDWFQKSINRQVATQMADLQEAAEKFVVLNMTRVLDDYVGSEDDVAEIQIATLIDRGFLPEDFKSRNAFNQEMRVVIRHAGADTVKGVAIEVLVLGDDRNGIDSRMSDKRLFDAALSGGPKLGLISSLNMGPNCCNGNIQSAYGEWSVPLSDFTAVYTRTPNAVRGGYMASYGRVAMQDVNNQDYLYRVEVPNAPHLNRMMTNMDMNANNILNAGVVVADTSQVSGNALIEGRSASGAVSPYVLAVQNSFAGSSMVVTADGARKGDLIISGDSDNTSHDLQITTNLSLPGSVVTSRGTVSTVQGMGEAAFDELRLSGGQFTAANVIAVTSSVSGNVQTNFLQTGGAQVRTISAPNAVVGITDVSGNANLNGPAVARTLAAEGGASSGGLYGTSNVAIQSLGSCGGDCPR